jgi:hypothetical protein
VRAGPLAAGFFSAVAERMPVDRDDQAAVNRTLLRKGIAWRKEGPQETRTWKEQPFQVFQRPLVGRCGDLSIALLPHRQFPRLPEVSAETIVAHPVSPKQAGSTIRELQRLGLWRHHI